MVNLRSIFVKSSSKFSNKLKTKITYRVDLSLSILAVVMYKDSNNNNRVERFYSNSWTKEVFVLLEESLELKLKAFINTSTLNLSEPGVLTLFISVDDEPVSTRSFEIVRESDQSKWHEIIYKP
jgi:hypothetical protein